MAIQTGEESRATSQADVVTPRVETITTTGEEALTTTATHITIQCIAVRRIATVLHSAEAVAAVEVLAEAAVAAVAVAVAAVEASEEEDSLILQNKKYKI